MGEVAEPAVMEDEDIFLRQMLRTEAHQMAAMLRRIEAVSPGCFGEATAVIRQLAAGDDVMPADLTAALASLRLTLQDAAALLGEDDASGVSGDIRGAGRWRHHGPIHPPTYFFLQ